MTVNSYPVWQTPAGNLGKIEALNFYDFNFVATDPLDGPITYKLIAGNLPAGMQVDVNGYLAGSPLEKYLIDGVPESVTQDRTSNFTIRATTSSGGITDRSFSITVTGNYPPQILTSNYLPLGNFLDGTLVNIQLEAIDLNNDVLTFKFASGELPLGLSLSSDGILSGILIPNTIGNYNQLPGWGKTQWDDYPWQFSPYSTNYTYNFVIEVTDGKSIVSQNYSINVYAHNDIRADNAYLTADNEIFTSDTSSDRMPILLTKQEDLGDYANFISGNYYAFKFEGIDLDGTPVGFGLSGQNGQIGWDVDSNGWDSQPWDQGTFSLPEGLTLDTNTGWLTGYIPEIPDIKTTYSFAIYAFNQYNPSIKSDPRVFTINILGALDLRVNWITSSDLGYIDNGSISQLYVEASAPSGRKLYYSLVNGSKLPQGLTLQNDGIISGRVTFQSFSIDGSASIRTTFDVNNYKLGKLSSPTTFDSTYTFTVIASDYSGNVQGEKTFTLKTNSVTYSSYDDLYIVCKPQLPKREILNTILGNTDYFAYADIYRPTDPWWGVQTDIKLLVGYGLTPSESSNYISAMQDRHYNKKFYFGDYGYAEAKDANGNIIYEVIYVNLVEDTKTYKTVGGQIVKNIPSNSIETKNGVIAYTNDLDLMYNDLVVAIGTTNTNTLPRWQTSIQSNGKTLGFQTSAVLAYLKPGTGKRVLYEIQNNVPADIKSIPFTADRYILDNNLDASFDIATQKWVTKSYTTFDTGYKPIISPVTTVDFAIDIPFDKIDKQTVTKINSIGGLDGSVGDYNNKLVIFATQENYSGYAGLTNDGWNQDNTVIPGYAELLNNSSSVNERGGVWLITVKNSQLHLSFVQEIQVNDVLAIRFGNRGGKKMQYTAGVIGYNNQTVPAYTVANVDSLELKSPTTFDNNKTRFVNNTDQYNVPFANDTYLKFPRVNIFQ